MLLQLHSSPAVSAWPRPEEEAGLHAFHISIRPSGPHTGCRSGLFPLPNTNSRPPGSLQIPCSLSKRLLQTLLLAHTNRNPPSPLYLQSQSKMDDWVARGRWQEVLEEKRGVLSSMMQVCAIQAS